MRRWWLGIAGVLIIVSGLAWAAVDTGDIICETSASTGTGTLDLGGAVTNYVTFVSQIATGSTVPYQLKASDGKLEVGTGTFTDGSPDTLSRSADWSSDGSATLLTLPAGTHRVCVGPITNNFVVSLVTALTGLELGGTNDTTIARSSAGEAIIEGDVIKHAGKQLGWVGAGAMKNSALTPASCGDTYDSGSNDVTIVVCAFDTGATEENAEFGFPMPKSWNESTITMQVAWTNTGGSASQTVQWKIACTGFGDGDALNTAYPADVTVSDTWAATNAYALTDETGSITVQNAAEGDYINCRIGRDTSVDNMSGDALLIGIKVYWTDNASTLSD